MIEQHNVSDRALTVDGPLLPALQPQGSALRGFALDAIFLGEINLIGSA